MRRRRSHHWPSTVGRRSSGITARLRHAPRVVVGTPGRLLDLAGSGHLYLGAVTWLVMDEADQMLDRGFLRDIQRILGLLPPERQTLLFSATFSAEIQQLAGTMQRNPAKISVDPGISSPTTITHAYYVVPAEHSRTQLVHTLLQAVKAGERSMIFCDQKYKVRRLASKLGGESASVGAITGNHSQAQRERTLGAFRAGRLTSLVATDVAARGLDIPDVAQVIHYELPVNPNSYVHRAGRTGRAEKEGSTFLILSQAEEREYLRMVRQLRIQTTKLSLPALATLPPAAVVTEERPARRPAQRRHSHHASPALHETRNGIGRDSRPSFRSDTAATIWALKPSDHASSGITIGKPSIVMHSPKIRSPHGTVTACRMPHATVSTRSSIQAHRGPRPGH